MGTNLYLVLCEHFFISKSKHSLFSLSSVAKENRLNKYGGSVCCLGRWIGLVIPCADRRNCLEKKIEAKGEKGYKVSQAMKKIYFRLQCQRPI